MMMQDLFDIFIIDLDWLLSSKILSLIIFILKFL